MYDRNSVAVDAADEQRSNRQHTGLRTLDETEGTHAHYSAREIAAACEVEYGTGVLREKAHQRAQASSERASARTNTSGGVTASDDRAGECGVSF